MDLIESAKTALWSPAELNQRAVEELLGRLMSRAVDVGELFFQSLRSESWVLDDGLVKEGSFSTDRGVGVRAVTGERTGFAYADDIALPALEQATEAARSIARAGQDKRVAVGSTSRVAAPARYPAIDPISTVDEAAKIALLERVDRHARALDPRVIEVNVRLGASYETILVVASDGTLAADARPLVRLDVTVLVEQDGRRERGHAGGGGRCGLDWLLEGDRAIGYADEAVRGALVNLEADAAPAGPMTVVLGPGWPGVLLHEAVGHGLEGDFNRKGSSAYSGRIGEQVASPLCSVVDDGTLDGLRGSLSIDDEGCATERTVLIENGILKGYMQDKLNARLMGTRSTGNGRRQSYGHLPMPRMTNTFMLAGEHAPEEIIASVPRGLYAANFGGGSVDITSGRFVFSATEAYLIENGKVTRPVKGATLIGNGPEVMRRVSMVGNDLALDQGVGICGKDGQSVPVGVGQPTLKIDEVIVGGTEA
ncbi:MAG: metalloprotease TldD [Gammaproteobacteria bacterium]|nr:MAG: metalloprotease TldD [Gammaproteobacteria bacterium]